MDKSLKSFIQFYYQRYRNLILYGIIGGISAGLDFAVYTLLCRFNLLGQIQMNDLITVQGYQIANVISIHCGIFCSFLLNRTYNFKTKDRVLQRFLSFYIIGLMGLLLSAVLLHVMVEMKGMNTIYAKVLVIIVVAVSQFLLNKFITFKKSK
jgi:putative flippase GtrA